jgi:hypothetical protein
MLSFPRSSPVFLDGGCECDVEVVKGMEGIGEQAQML